MDTRRRCLLLMQLFVLKAAANCPKPQGGLNIVLTNEALLMNHFPEGSGATVECANGFVAESGSGAMSCTAGKWTEPDLRCKKKDCGPPKSQPHMTFNISGGTLFGAEIQVMCEKGFQIIGVGFRTCYASGWSRGAKCGIVKCDQPPQVANGKVLWDSRGNHTYGEILTFVCHDGFVLIGSNSSVCNESGDYDPQPPECKGVTAEDRITPDTLTAAPAQDSSTAHRDKTTTTSVSLAEQGGTDSLEAEDKAVTTRPSPTTLIFRDKQDGRVNTDTDPGHVAVVVSVVCVSLVVIILVFSSYKWLLRRKGTVVIC